jgi:outer membrane protein assembly factor BamB
MVYIVPHSDEMLMNAPNSLAAKAAAEAIWSLALLTALAGCGNRMVAQTDPAISRPAASADNSSSSDESQWPVFRGNAQATGVSAGHLTEQPELQWKYNVEKGAFEATPVIVDSTVYIGDMDGTFYALDLQSGAKRWTFDQGKDKAGFTAAAAVRDGMVYIGDMDGAFFCLDAKTGEKKWEATSDGEIDSAANFYQGNVLFGSQDTTLYCLDAKTGQRQWTHQIGDQIRCSPTVIENCCFLAGCDGKLHVIDLHHGEETGAVDIHSPTGCTPAASGNLIYFGTEGGTFFSVNWKELKSVWMWQDKAKGLSIRASAALTPQAVIFGGRDKTVHARDPQTGEKLWDFATKGRVDSSPVVVDERVYVGSADGRVYGFDLKSGQPVWQYEAGGALVGSPAVAQGRLVIASDAGVVYCFGDKK